MEQQRWRKAGWQSQPRFKQPPASWYCAPLATIADLPFVHTRRLGRAPHRVAFHLLSHQSELYFRAREQSCLSDHSCVHILDGGKYLWAKKKILVTSRVNIWNLFVQTMYFITRPCAGLGYDIDKLCGIKPWWNDESYRPPSRTRDTQVKLVRRSKRNIESAIFCNNKVEMIVQNSWTCLRFDANAPEATRRCMQVNGFNQETKFVESRMSQCT